MLLLLLRIVLWTFAGLPKKWHFNFDLQVLRAGLALRMVVSIPPCRRAHLLPTPFPDPSRCSLHLLLCTQTFPHSCSTPCRCRGNLSVWVPHKACFSVHTSLLDACSDSFPIKRQKYKAFWDWTILWTDGWMVSSRPGGSRVKCSCLSADSVMSTALALKCSVFCIKPNTVMLRGRALLRGGFHPVFRGRYAHVKITRILGGPGWFSFSLCCVLSV